MLSRIAIVLSLFCLNGLCLSAQTFSLRQINDTCNVLVLTTDSMSDEWLLPHPVYQFRTGDVDGDGVEEALVGVVKSTRFYPEKGNRLFVFKTATEESARCGWDRDWAKRSWISAWRTANWSASNDAGTDNTTWTSGNGRGSGPVSRDIS